MKGLEFLHKLVWGPWLLFLFLGTGVVCSIRLNGFPVLHPGIWWQETAGQLGMQGKKNRAQLRTACTALAATVGTGNITGVTAALAAGGPGAVFWMWISAGLGLATAYAEVYLGIYYRRKENRKADESDSVISGPFAYMEAGLKWKWPAFCYAFFTVLASLGMGSMVQAASLTGSVCYAAPLSKLMVGILLTGLTGAVILGGIKRISGAAAVLVPVSAGCYLFFGGIIVICCYRQIPGILQEIVSQAFNLKSVSGGAAGYTMAQAIRSGVARGVFSNEAGLGSLALVHGSAEADAVPENQGLWAIFEVFFDTLVCCTLTALILLCAGEAGQGSEAVAACFSAFFGRFGGWFTAASMASFAFATIIAWFYLGRQAAEYLFRDAVWRLLLLRLYPFFYLAAVFSGCVARLYSIWLLSDIFNGLMAVPNLLAVLCLIKKVKEPERAERKKRNRGK